MSANGEIYKHDKCMFAGMSQDKRSLYKALIARDLRFDGLFFVGVTSTGIYCRPICPVKPPSPAPFGSAPALISTGKNWFALSLTRSEHDHKLGSLGRLAEPY